MLIYTLEFEYFHNTTYFFIKYRHLSVYWGSFLTIRQFSFLLESRHSNFSASKHR